MRIRYGVYGSQWARGVVAIVALGAQSALGGCSGCSGQTNGGAKPPPTTSTGPAAVAGKGLAPGEQLAVPMPATSKHPENFGMGLQLALDEVRAPALLWVWRDPNDDGDVKDTQVQFTRWDGAAGAFVAPVTVTVADVQPSVRPDTIALAYDASTHVFAATWRTLQAEIAYATSADGGAHWSASVIANHKEFGGLSPAAIALHDGVATFAFGSAKGVSLRTGPELDPRAWSETMAPALPDGARPREAPPRIAIDDAGHVALAFVSSPQREYNSIAWFWRPGQTPSPVMDSNGVQNDNPYVDLAFAGSRAVVAFGAHREHGDHFPLYVSSSPDGTAWSAPAYVTPDGPHGAGFPSLAITAGGAAAITFMPNGGGGSSETKCANPKLARSSDLTTWSTCSPDEKKTWLVDYPGDPRVAVGPADKLILALRTQGHRDGRGLAGGIWVFLER
jgi:hypothetical protein